MVFSGVAQQMKLDATQIQQWLTDISATRAQDGLDDGFDEAETCYQSFISGLEKFRGMYEEENDSALTDYCANSNPAISRAYNYMSPMLLRKT